MTHSIAHSLHHIVFATKGRRPLLRGGVRAEMHRYLGGTLKNMRGLAYAVNGTADHVHILASIHRDYSLSSLMRELKANSSRWIRSRPGYAQFRWQVGYFSLTLANSNVDTVVRYIEDQEVHHRTISARDELRELLLANEVKFDERDLDAD